MKSYISSQSLYIIEAIQFGRYSSHGLHYNGITFEIASLLDFHVEEYSYY